MKQLTPEGEVEIMLAARPQKITFGEMRNDMGVHGVLVYCADYRCSHSVALSADRWADDIRLSDIEPRFVCAACGKRAAEVRPDLNWGEKPTLASQGSEAVNCPSDIGSLT